MKISVIILVYNGEKYLADLLRSLNETRHPAGEYEIIFVDNASLDNSVEIIKNYNLQNSRLIRNIRNLGFAGGNNVGLRQAMVNRADYIVLLNQDTVVDAGWLEELVKVAEREKDAGAVQALLLYADEKDVINSAGNYIHFLGFEFAGGNLQKMSNVKSQMSNVKEITYASGAAVMYQAEVLKKIGLFDETLESYHEDADICLRLRLFGYKSYLAPRAVVYHKYEFLKSVQLNQFKRTSPDLSLARRGGGFNYKYYLMERNRLYTLLKYYNQKTLLLIFPAWLIMEFGVLLFALVKGFWREKLKGYSWLVESYKLIVNNRKEIQNLKRLNNVSDKELTQDFVGWIDYQEIKNPLLTFIGNPVMRGYWKFIKLFI